MSADRRDEIDEVLSKYLPSKGASGGERTPEDSAGSRDVAEPKDSSEERDDGNAQEGPDELTDGMFAWVKTNLIFIFLASFLALSLVTIIID